MLARVRVCVHVWTYVCRRVHTCVHMRVCTRVRVCARKRS